MSATQDHNASTLRSIREAIGSPNSAEARIFLDGILRLGARVLPLAFPLIRDQDPLVRAHGLAFLYSAISSGRVSDIDQAKAAGVVIDSPWPLSSTEGLARARCILLLPPLFHTQTLKYLASPPPNQTPDLLARHQLALQFCTLIGSRVLPYFDTVLSNNPTKLVFEVCLSVVPHLEDTVHRTQMANYALASIGSFVLESLEILEVLSIKHGDTGFLARMWTALVPLTVHGGIVSSRALSVIVNVLSQDTLHCLCSLEVSVKQSFFNALYTSLSGFDLTCSSLAVNILLQMWPMLLKAPPNPALQPLVTPADFGGFCSQVLEACASRMLAIRESSVGVDIVCGDDSSTVECEVSALLNSMNMLIRTMTDSAPGILVQVAYGYVKTHILPSQLNLQAVIALRIGNSVLSGSILKAMMADSEQRSAHALYKGLFGAMLVPIQSNSSNLTVVQTLFIGEQISTISKFKGMLVHDHAMLIDAFRILLGFLFIGNPDVFKHRQSVETLIPKQVYMCLLNLLSNPLICQSIALNFHEELHNATLNLWNRYDGALFASELSEVSLRVALGHKDDTLRRDAVSRYLKSSLAFLCTIRESNDLEWFAKWVLQDSEQCMQNRVRLTMEITRIASILNVFKAYLTIGCVPEVLHSSHWVLSKSLPIIGIIQKELNLAEIHTESRYWTEDLALSNFKFKLRKWISQMRSTIYSCAGVSVGDLLLLREHDIGPIITKDINSIPLDSLGELLIALVIPVCKACPVRLYNQWLVPFLLHILPILHSRFVGGSPSAATTSQYPEIEDIWITNSFNRAILGFSELCSTLCGVHEVFHDSPEKSRSAVIKLSLTQLVVVNPQLYPLLCSVILVILSFKHDNGRIQAARSLIMLHRVVSLSPLHRNILSPAIKVARATASLESESLSSNCPTLLHLLRTVVSEWDSNFSFVTKISEGKISGAG